MHTSMSNGRTGKANRPTAPTNFSAAIKRLLEPHLVSPWREKLTFGGPRIEEAVVKFTPALAQVPAQGRVFRLPS